MKKKVIFIHIYIVGGGALGLLFAGKLSLTIDHVRLVTHSLEQSEVILDHKLQLCEDTLIQQISVNCIPFNSLDEFDMHADWIFLMVKQRHINDHLVQTLRKWSDHGAHILCFQNGLGHIERLIQEIPRSRVYTALTTEAARKESSSRVTHTGMGITWIGREHCQENGQESNSLVENSLLKSLQNAGFDAALSKNIKDKAWSKLLANSIINPLTAILKVRNGELIHSSEWVQLMKSLYTEGRQVADALGIDLPEDHWDQIIGICESTAMNTSSMLEDAIKGHLTEIDWINGRIIEIAQQRQLSVPTHQAIYHLIKGNGTSI